MLKIDKKPKIQKKIEEDENRFQKSIGGYV